jgi:hypothetical protein
MGIAEKPRKFTDNMLESKMRKKKENHKQGEHENSTTIEGTSAITPLFQSRKDSTGFEAYAASMMSTPKMKSGYIMCQTTEAKALNHIAEDQNSAVENSDKIMNENSIKKEVPNEKAE